ncbi:MAG: DUF6056 family protein [Eubacteriales bacterium]|nr:DUF6056 family protein [Eubacteriales bacterium]
MNKLCVKRFLSTRTLTWLCVAALLVSLTPLYAISFYNHACYDDFGFSIQTHTAWKATGSFLETVKAAFQNTVAIRQTWEGTYSTSLISALQPALFGENLYWLTTVLLLTFFLLSLWLFLRETLIRQFHADKQSFWLAFSALAFVMIQFVPDLSESFFWFNGGVAYTLLWSMMLLRFTVWLKLERAKRPVSRALWLALMLLLTVAVGGAKYSTVLFALLLDAVCLFIAFRQKKPLRFVELGITLLLLGCLLFSVTAPGNAVRAATLQGGMSAPKAILQAFYFGLALMGNWFSLPLLVVWALVAWQLSEALRGSVMRFGHPVFITIGAVCLFCAQLTPTLVTGNYLGDGRAVSTYYYTFVILSCALALYWMGWYLRRGEDRAELPAIGTAKRDGLKLGAFCVALVLLLVGCVGYQPEGAESYGPQYMASGSTLRSLLNGQAAVYDAAMDQRDAEMNDSDVSEVILQPVEDGPDAFMGDAALSDMKDYVQSLYAEYYGKQSVTVKEDENAAE